VYLKTSHVETTKTALLLGEVKRRTLLTMPKEEFHIS